MKGAGVPDPTTICMMVRVLGPKPGRGRGCAAGIALIRVARVVVDARVECRNRRGRVVIENECLAGIPREVDDDVRPLGRSQQEGVLEDIQDRDASAGVFIADGRWGNHCRRRQDAAFGADHDHVRASGARIRHASIPSVCRPGIRPAAGCGVRHRDPCEAEIGHKIREA